MNSSNSSSSLRVAISTGVWRVPPFYFLSDQIIYLQKNHPTSVEEVKAFSFISEMPTVIPTGAKLENSIPVYSATPNYFPSLLRKALIPWRYRHFAKALCAWNPDLIHQHFGTWSTPAIAAGRRIKIPIITTFHGYDAYIFFRQQKSLYSQWQVKEARRAIDASTTVLSVSNFLADKLIESGCPHSKLLVNYLGVDTDFFTPVEEQFWNEIPRILVVGHLAPHKGTHELLKWSTQIIPRIPHTIEFVGDGELRDQVQKASTEHSHIKWHGLRNKEQLRDLYRSSDLHVLAAKRHPILGSEEAAGIVTLEAQACGLPVVVWGSGGTKEMLVHEETGFVAIAESEKSLADSLESALLLTGPERRDMGRKGREWVVKNRSLKSGAEQLLDIYKNAIS